MYHNVNQNLIFRQQDFHHYSSKEGFPLFPITHKPFKLQYCSSCCSDLIFWCTFNHFYLINIVRRSILTTHTHTHFAFITANDKYVAGAETNMKIERKNF